MISNGFSSRKEVMDLARQLGEALASSKELYDYREAERKVASDPEACRLTRVFKQKHLEFIAKQEDPHCKQRDLEICAAELEAADRDMKKNPLIAAYYRTGSAFNNLIYQINQLLKHYTIDPEESAKFRQASCNKCSGCEHK